MTNSWAFPFEKLMVSGGRRADSEVILLRRFLYIITISKTESMDLANNIFIKKGKNATGITSVKELAVI
jgi:hypothetical protein